VSAIKSSGRNRTSPWTDPLAFDLQQMWDETVIGSLGDNMRYHLVTLALIVAALMLDTSGFSSGGLLLLAAGVASEAAFWLRLVHARQRRRQVDAFHLKRMH
jgi:hypothetical protein